ncbi:MAG: alpha/beta hydrolase [Myxococcota bacterium]
MQPTIVYVHGAFISNSSWWWHRTGDLLKEKGFESRTIDLPSCGPKPPLGDLHADADAVRKLLQEIEGPVILVAHSYGGQVVSEAAVGQKNVKHLVYISAPVNDGVSLGESDFISDEKKENPLEEIDIGDDGTAGEGEGRFKTRVLEAFPDPNMTHEALSRLTRQSLAVFTQPPSGAAWKEIPSTYVVCLEDGDVAVPEQRKQAARTTFSIDVPTNHFPHLERPELVLDIILDIINKVKEKETQTA